MYAFTGLDVSFSIGEGILDFCYTDFTKEQVIDAIRKFIPTFKHEEKGKNLDQKM